ncbi:MAG TPA: GDSL-type esterase/lipase family protein [Acidimicrobiales bacterium]|nr:GDSL-type esterase/lipase family protein [Acidimicrobiales bacterium]
MGAALLLLAALAALAPTAASSASATAPPPFDLALGGSGSVGFQPTWGHTHGQPTDSGYADDLAAHEASRWPGLTLVQIGCPGMTTQTMISGGGHCAYEAGSQLATALSFLHTHPSTVLVTVDLGFNDLVPCLHHVEVKTDCVDSALATVQSQLPQILSALRSAAPAGTHMIGVGHYDPYLGDAMHGPAGEAFAQASLGVIVRLNDVLRAAYTQAGMPMANVGAAFQLHDASPIDVPGLGTVPTDVARVCALTWMCAAPPLGPNTHPNDNGYRVASNAIAAALTPITSR